MRATAVLPSEWRCNWSSNWARDYAAVWAHLAKKVDDLDRTALKPVSVVVESLIEEDELSANDFDRWVRQPSAKVA